MSVAALALLPRRNAPTLSCGAHSLPYGRDTTLNTSVSSVKGRPQAAFFMSGCGEERGRAVERSARHLPGAGGIRDEGSDKPLSEARRWIRVAQERRSSTRGGSYGDHQETSCG
jgi:hypothetical protein